MRAFARSIVDTVRHPLLILDDALRVVIANASFYRAFGGSPAGILGQDLFEIDNGRWNYGPIRSLLLNIIPQSGSLQDYEVEYVTPESRRILMLDAQRVTHDEDGFPVILLSIEDVTVERQAIDDLERLNDELECRVADRTLALNQANRELLDANQELGAANRELEAFCFSVSHDLRAPLRALDGFSQELLQTYADKLDNQGQHYLRRIRAGTQRMGQLIDDLLQLSRVTRAEMRREVVDLTELAESVFAELREHQPDRTVLFTAQPGMIALCDPPLIRAVLENLLGNAWKFTANKQNAVIKFEAAERLGDRVFSVRDDGAGFDMAFAGKLFRAFQRLHSDREFPGTGVGLATVDRIIRRHGGKVWAEGAVGVGSTFFFTIPLPENHI